MRRLWLLPAVPIAALDQWVKWWATENLLPKVVFSSQLHFTQPFVPGVDLTYVTNTGAAFSMLGGGAARWFLAAVSALAAAAIVVTVCKGWVTRPFGVISLSCVLGGAAGNLIDRVWQGYVVDMFEFTFVKFAIFNVADIFISVGGACLVLYLLLDARKKGPDAGLDKDLGTDGDED